METLIENQERDSLELMFKLVGIKISNKHQGTLCKKRYYGIIEYNNKIVQFRLEVSEDIEFSVSLIDKGVVASGNMLNDILVYSELDISDIENIRRYLELKYLGMAQSMGNENIKWI